ncbi:DUF5443 family protein [Mycoplasmoides pirum]|uniref:DUF5443 family protein n=1 Tax=Mycoplasmoides pirum TaxID=2122 RepID=UPI000485643C|nr:DUF5443 family protein [Mycoplasmoides pirum]
MIDTYSYYENNIKENWWTLTPNDFNSNVYFEAKLYSTNISTTNSYINFDIKVSIRCKSALPKNLILASFSIPEFNKIDIPIIPIEVESNMDEWKIYKISVQVPKNSLSYINDNLNNLLVPIKINFACNQTILSEIKNDFDSTALKYFLDNLYDSIVTTNVNLDTFFSFSSNFGSTSLYDVFPSTSDELGKTFKFSWNTQNYLKLIKSQMINELLNITSSIPMIVSNLNINFYYHVSNENGYKSLNYSENKNYSLKQNETLSIKLPFKVSYDETKKELVKDVLLGHNFLLPNGGNGYYELNFKIQTENAYYKIIATNYFNYLTPLNNLNFLDFFTFNYHQILSLNNFNKLN